MTDTTSTKRYFFWLALGLVFFTFIYMISGVLLPFVLGAGIAYFLDPAADRLEKWGFSRSVATAIITLTFFTILVLIGLLIIPTLAEQLSGLIADIPSYVQMFEDRYEPEIRDWLGMLPKGSLGNLKDPAIGVAGSVASSVFHSGMAVVNVLSLFLLTPVVSFYLLRDWDRMVAKLHDLLPRPHVNTIREQLMIIDRTLAGFVRGQINVCVLLGTFYAVGLSLVGLKFGILIGLATGFLVILPYVGILFGMVTGLSVAFFQFDNMQHVGAVLAVFVVGQILEGNFVTPKLVGEKVGLHPVWVIFGMLAGASLFGFVGVLIAVPTTAVIGVLTRFALDKYVHSGYYKGEGRVKKTPAK